MEKPTRIFLELVIAPRLVERFLLVGGLLRRCCGAEVGGEAMKDCPNERIYSVHHFLIICAFDSDMQVLFILPLISSLS